MGNPPVDNPTNTITMVVPFTATATATWLWQISHPYNPQEPLPKG